MLASTMEILKAGLRADPTVSLDERKRWAALMRGTGNPPTPAAIAKGPRIIGRKAVAERFGRSIRFVDRLAAQGVLRKMRLPGRVRATGFLESDVEAVIAGGGA